ncbi:MAG: caspase family protein [Treponema sp.]|jgi:hypothetical protein|nr:caspase family protein [Treponema sp.]
MKKKLRALSSLTYILFACFAAQILAAQDKGIEVVAAQHLGEQARVGKQYALFIAIDRYRAWPALKRPVADAQEIRDILREQYYIDELIELYNADASRTNIARIFTELQGKLGTHDSLFIYYAGHGHFDEASNAGFWIPADAGTDVYAQENWLSNSQIRGYISRLKSIHVFMMNDTCFSGDILNTSRSRPAVIDNAYYRRAYSLISRQVLTAGSSEKVPDESEFSQAIKMCLRKNTAPLLDPYAIYSDIRLSIQASTPLLGNLNQASHQDGATFIFFKRPAPIAPGQTLVAHPPQTTVVTLDSPAMREQFNGDWIGEDTRIQINGDRIVQYFMDEAGEWYAVSPEKEYFLYDRNNLVYVWLNKGGVWSETQVFSLSVINADALSLVWQRHVNNIADNQQNEAWNVKEKQTLFRWKNSGAFAAKQVSSSRNTQIIDAQFQGTWIGEITVKDEDGDEAGKIPLRVTISSSGVTQYFQDNNGNWYAVSADKDTYAYDRNNIVYSWVNKGGVWSETQVYSLSILTNKTMSIVWLRHVNNYRETFFINNVWNLTGEGELTKQ